MLSWTDDLPKASGMTRAGSNSTQRGPGLSLSTSPSARRSMELAGSPKVASSYGSPGGAKASPLVKEGTRFGGWSHFVDNGHLNNPAEPDNERPAAPAPAPVVTPVSAAPATTTVGFEPAAAEAAPGTADGLATVASAGAAVPPAGQVPTDGNGWWTKMPQGILNEKGDEAPKVGSAASYKPQFEITGQRKELDWGSVGGAAEEKKQGEWNPF